MRPSKYLTILSLIILVFNQPILSQSDSWKNAYSDVEINLSDFNFTIGLAGGYKINRFAGIGLKFEKSIEADNQNILSLNFRGTNFKPGDRWGFYYTASFGKGFGDYKYDIFDLAIGVRYERLGIGLGLYDNEVNLKISHLLGDFKGRGTLLGKAFSPSPKKRDGKSIDGDKDNSYKNRSSYFHFLIGTGSVNDHIIFKNFNRRVHSYNLGGGAQVNNYLGYGVALRGGSSINSQGDNLNFLALGVNFNGYPNIFFYNVTLGSVINYSLVDDGEYPGLRFEMSKGFPLYFEIKGGIRLFRKVSLGMAYFASSKIKGNYKEYDNPGASGNSTLVIDEIRQSKFSGIQFFIGVAF
ncbi:MAG: hypothetical protein ACJAT4_000240 [Granulosicoccus sp.]|jgi:hypothetical protein